MMKPKKEILTPEEMFCLDAYLLNGDIDMAYRLSRKTQRIDSESHHRLALRWKSTPLVEKYLKERTLSISAKQDNNDNTQYRDKDSVLSALEKEVPYLRGKDKLDALMKIADLQQLKKDENKTDEERVHFYLPLQMCVDCNKRDNLIIKRG